MITPKIYCFIPCNLDSKRLPNKPLLEKNGKTILEHTYTLANAIRCLMRPPIVLYSDREVEKVIKRIPFYDEQIGLLTKNFDNGTLRCAHAAKVLPFDMNDDDIIINVQVDEVEFNPEIISEKLIKYIEQDWILGTYAYSKRKNTAYGPEHVKVDTDLRGFANYFSRQNIFGAIHVGIYVYRVFALKEYANFYRFSNLSIKKENLEQMLFFDLDMKFAVMDHIHPTISINTEDDYNAWLQR